MKWTWTLTLTQLERCYGALLISKNAHSFINTLSQLLNNKHDNVNAYLRPCLVSCSQSSWLTMSDFTLIICLKAFCWEWFSVNYQFKTKQRRSISRCSRVYLGCTDCQKSVWSNLPAVDDETKDPTANREDCHSTREDRI